MKLIELREIINLLKKYNLNFVESVVIKDKNIFDKIKYPIVLKVSSNKIIHKSDCGGVITNINNKKDAVENFNKLKRISKNIIAQKMVYGKEIIIGMKKDPQFGPVVMFGLGGIFVEIMKDVVFRICPIEKKEAIEMIKEIKSYSILEGVRGEKKVNINKIADIIVKISNLSLKEDINEIDLNPVIINDGGAFIVDARFMR